MSDFLRPAARAALVRHSGLILAAAVAALGLWWLSTGLGFMRVIGGLLIALGAVLGWSAWQRQRFGDSGAAAGEAPGLVEVVEGQISYMGPAGGGFAALSELSEIHIAVRDGRRAWVLFSPGQPDLVIPVGAAGAEALFDAFGSLPGLRAADLLSAIEQGGGAAPQAGLPALRLARPMLRLIWRRPAAALERDRQ